MASASRLAYASLADKARAIAAAAASARDTPLSKSRVEILLHASLAFHVSAWQSYIVAILTEYFDLTRDPHSPKFDAVHGIAEESFKKSKKKFNTPNWENSRTLMIECCGLDPLNYWIWAKRAWTVQMVKERLNQVLQVRHSFAHGYAIPAYPWTQASSGLVRLNLASLEETRLFFANLVSATDRGMQSHLMSIYGLKPKWY